jgi:hypothetical protein
MRPIKSVCPPYLQYTIPTLLVLVMTLRKAAKSGSLAVEITFNVEDFNVMEMRGH